MPPKAKPKGRPKKKLRASPKQNAGRAPLSNSSDEQEAGQAETPPAARRQSVPLEATPGSAAKKRFDMSKTADEAAELNCIGKSVDERTKCRVVLLTHSHTEIGGLMSPTMIGNRQEYFEICNNLFTKIAKEKMDHRNNRQNPETRTHNNLHVVEH